MFINYCSVHPSPVIVSASCLMLVDVSAPSENHFDNQNSVVYRIQRLGTVKIFKF